MTTMNDATKMAVTLARKGASDEVIALVMEALTTHREHIDAARSAAVTASPAAREMVGEMMSGATRESRYRPLLDAIRKQVSASGPVEATARELCEMHKEEWALSRIGLGGSDNARGFAAVLANATSGVVGYCATIHGVRVTFMRKRYGNNGGEGVSVYRVEMA